MSDLEKMKMKLELMKVQAAKFGMEVKIGERMEDIKRLEENILVQGSREKELKEILGEK